MGNPMNWYGILKAGVGAVLIVVWAINGKAELLAVGATLLGDEGLRAGAKATSARRKKA